MSDIKKSGNLNRRDFIKSGGALAAGAAAIAAIGSPAIVRGQNLNSKLNFGVIGTGSRAGSILRAIRGDEYLNVTDLCDVFPPHLEETKNYIDNTEPRTTENWEDVIARDDVDCVIVSTPLFLHVPIERCRSQGRQACLQRKEHGPFHEAAQRDGSRCRPESGPSLSCRLPGTSEQRG